MDEKQCNKCGITKPLEGFHRRAKSRDGRQPTCAQCYRDAVVEFRKTTPPKKGGSKPLDPIERKARKHASNKRTYEKHKAARLATAAIYRQNNKDRETANRRAHYQRNKARVAAVTRAYQITHPDLYAAAYAKRRATKLKATPVWADFEKIDAVYAEARRLTEETGVPHEVDHFYPLQGVGVCGLHVHQNLRVITRFDNRSKRNRVVDD